MKTVFINLETSLVNLKGVWSRRDIDKAYKLMLNNLPGHIKKLKEAEEEEWARQQL